MISALAENALVLELKNNTTIEYLTKNLPVVTKQGENVVVTYKEKSSDYLIVDVHKFYFAEASITSAENVKMESNGKLLVSVSDTQIDVYGADGIVSIFDMNGRCVKQTKSVESHVSFDKPSAGVYVIKTGEKSTKIIVR